MADCFSGKLVASLTSGTEIAVIVAVAVSIVLVVGRLTRGAAVAAPVFGFGFRDIKSFKVAPRALGRLLQPDGAALAPWLQQRLNALVAVFARVHSSVASLAGIAAPANSIPSAGAASVKSLLKASRPQRIAAVGIQSHRLTADMQWDRVSRTIKRAVDGAAQARSAHGTAAIKLDAADYEFERLLVELGSVMKLKPLPAEVAEFPLAQRARGMRQGGTRVAA